jgi:ribosomal protein S18 acetylase RimI-like enzyme
MNSDTLEAGCPSYDSGMNFEIRSISPKDAAEFWALRFEMLELEPFAYSADLEDHADSSISDQLRRLEGLTGGDCAVGAWFEGELVGAAVLRCEPGRKFSHKANVFSVYVKPHARGQGIARAIMVEVIARARMLPQVTQLNIGVMSTQTAARALYESLGFQAWGCEPRALRIEGVFADETYMVLNLR